MQVTKEQIDPCKIALTISVEPEKVRVAKEKAFANAAKSLQLPGFRKGKVPLTLARPYIDQSRVNQRATEMLVGPAYTEALEESEVEPFGGLQPEMELVEFPQDDAGSLVFKAYVPLRPVVTLGPYKGLEVEKRTLEVTDADVDRQIEELRARQAQYPEVEDRAAQMGDVLLADVTAEIENNEGETETSEPRSTVIEIGKNIPDFDNGLVGIAVGDTKTIDALYPEDFADPNLRGKRATFTVSVKEIRAKILPEINEEFLERVRPGTKTEEELRTGIRETLEQNAQDMAENDLDFEIVGKIVQNSQVAYPDALLRAEMQVDINALQERLQRDNLTFEQFLQATGRTQQDVQNEFAANADRRIRNSLTLSEIARTEELTATDEDINAQIEDRAARSKVSAAAVRAFLEKQNQMDQVRDQALTEKILQFLKEQTTITERKVTAEELRKIAEEQTNPVSEIEAEAATLAENEGEPAPEAPLAEAKPKARRSTKKADAAAAESAESPAEGAGSEAASETAEAGATE